MPFSHLDLFWAGTREECLARGNRIMAKAVGIANEHPEFRFFLESDNFVNNFVESHGGSPELVDLKRLIREGRIEIAPNWADIFLNQPDGEVLARNLLYGKQYARLVFNVDPQVFSPTDIPGFAPQLPQILAQARIPSMVMTRIGPPDRSLFNWEAPDRSRVLVWNAIRGYAWGVNLKLHDQLTDASLTRLRKELNETRGTTSGPIYLPWGLDLWAPTDKLVSNIPELNRDFPESHFLMATPQAFFKATGSTKDIPSLSGEIPLAWPHVIDSILHLWQLAVPATNTLESAEKFAAINYALGYADYPQQDLESLWKALIESMDHNHDGQGGELGDKEKMEDSQRVIVHGGEILRTMLRNIAERVEISIKHSAPIVVFNPLGWKRDDFVRAHVTLFGDVSPAEIGDYKKGMRLVDQGGKSVPFYVEQTSENISRALEITFIAQGVPAMGYKTYFLVPAEQESQPAVSTIKLDRENDAKEPRRPLGKDVIENQYYRVTVDKATGWVEIFDQQLNRDIAWNMAVVAEEERGTNNVQREINTGRVIPMVVSDTEVEENSPVRTVLRVSGSIAETPIVQRVVLYQNLKRVDIENSLVWNESRLLRIEQLIAAPTHNANFRYGVPFGTSSPQEILPDSGPRAEDEIQRDIWEKYRIIQSWVYAGGPEWGLTVAADHQLIEIDGDVLRMNMIRGQRYTSVKTVRGDEVTSTHFPAKGHYTFRYSLSSASGDWKAAHSYQIGQSLNNPLLAVSVVDEISRKSLPPTYSFVSLSKDNLVISALKKSEADPSLVLRVSEIEGKNTDSDLLFAGKTQKVRETNLLEEEARAPEQNLRFRPFEIKTVRLRPGPYTAIR